MSKYNNMKSIPIDSLNEEKLKIYNIYFRYSRRQIMSKYNNMKSIPIDSLNEEKLKEKKEIKN